MASKPRKPMDSAMSDERARGSVFDRLGAKQTMSQPPYHHQIRSSSNKMQSSKYENSDYPLKSEARRKLDHPASYHTSSHNRHYGSSSGSGNQYAQESNYSQQQPPPFRPQTSKPVIKSKINKDDLHHHDPYKNKHYTDQGAEVLEKKRIELKRELQKMDQQHDPNPHNRRPRTYNKSPCSSHDSCSSSGSGSESGSGSYTGSSGSSCSSSSCSSFSEEEVPRKKASQQLPRTKSYIVDAKSTVAQQHQQQQQHQLKSSKRNQSQSYQPNSSADNAYSKRLKAGSPQSTTSSYYSRKSARAGPLTPPLPTSSHHSLSNTPSSSTKLTGENSSGGAMKLDRHGNVRVSLQDKERQQQRRSVQPINSPASFGSQHNLSMNYSTKSSRSPMSRSREDLYSSFGSEEKKKFTPSPIHHPPFHNPRSNKQPHGYYDEQPYKSPNSPRPFFYNPNNKQSSAPNLRQNMQAHRSPVDNYYMSPVNHRNVSPYGPPRTPPLPSHHPPQSAMMNKPNKFMDYNDPLKPHPLDPLSAGWQPMKRNFNKFNNNMQQQPPFNPDHATLPHHPSSQQQQQQQLNYSPLRTKSSLSNTQHYPDSQPPFKKQSFANFSSKQTANKSISINQNATKNQNLKTVQQTVQPTTVKQVLAAKPPVSAAAAAAAPNKLVDQVAADEISSISNNSLEDMDTPNEEQKRAESNQSNKVNVGTVAAKEKDSDESLKTEESKDGAAADKVDEPTEGDAKQSDEKPNEDAAGGPKKDKEQDRFSDENFSEWSDIDEYYSKTEHNQILVEDSVSIPAAGVGDKLPVANSNHNKNRSNKSLDNDDDLKFKIDEELDEISDTEFDGIIDEQHAENEKNGLLSCKQVLDQLDINWASLMGDGETEGRKQSISTSTDVLSRFRPAKLLSQIGISSKYSGPELRTLIRNFCSTQLNDENFDFESPLAILHSSKRRKNNKPTGDQVLNSDLRTNASSPANELEVRKLVSNGDLLGAKKILSFNQLVQELRRKQEAIDGQKKSAAVKTASNEPEGSKPLA